MGFRFRKSKKIAPGVKINFNKKSVGLTVGKKGAHYTVNSKGKKTASVGIPGTGLSYSETSGGGNSNSGTNSSTTTTNALEENVSGCGSCLIVLFVGGLALAALSLVLNYAWIPGIIAMIYFAIKVSDKKQKFIRIGIAGAITLFSLIFFFTNNKQPDSINVEWEKQEYDIAETVELKITCEPEDANISSLSISDNDIAILNYSDGKAIITFKNEGTASIYFTANDSVTSDSTTITVIDKKAQAKREKEEAERKAEEEAKKKAELEAQKKAEEEAKKKAEEEAQKKAAEEAAAQAAAAQAAAEQAASNQVVAEQPQEQMVWIPQSGGKYHSKSSCSGMNNPTQVTLSYAQSLGYEPCKRCH